MDELIVHFKRIILGTHTYLFSPDEDRVTFFLAQNNSCEFLATIFLNGFLTSSQSRWIKWAFCPLKIFLTMKNRKFRLSFSKSMINKTETFWNNVIFADEGKFNNLDSDGRMEKKK